MTHPDLKDCHNIEGDSYTCDCEKTFKISDPRTMIAFGPGSDALCCGAGEDCMGDEFLVVYMERGA